jgi:hypothetical protein
MREWAAVATGIAVALARSREKVGRLGRAPHQQAADIPSVSIMVAVMLLIGVADWRATVLVSWRTRFFAWRRGARLIRGPDQPMVGEIGDHCDCDVRSDLVLTDREPDEKA